jgi:NADPH:quinone reductase-like Zn-dependent oxidoreductase
MRSIVRDRYGSPDVLTLEEGETPVPGRGEVVVKVHAASVNTADLDHLQGVPIAARLFTGVWRPRNRRTGLDVAGRVEAVGAGVDRLRPGDDVWADLYSFGQGAFAEYVCAKEAAFTPKPAGLTFEESATVPHSGVLALQAVLAKGGIRPGEKVLINGAGGCVGPFAVQIAKSLGAEVTGVDHSDKLALVRSAGADHVIDYTCEDFTRNGVRYDFILDIAARRSILRFRRSLAGGGRYVLVARSLTGFFQALILGAMITMAGNRRMGVFQWVPNRREDLQRLGHLLETGSIVPLIDRRYPLPELPEALRHAMTGPSGGKIVIVV